ncbi:hypothetical protein N7495_008843 [Penicillium taxi]|uniref:uncharacterized protein n=1 Tax=Penicillium taxi TaxID=168475 RepID=UPI0025458872|nr:uncharacterized protein N7495_008843 [Penicillium taxi]KAJ5888802.1 hypothetical protein N7495_008843 [Penicillium taxi]
MSSQEGVWSFAKTVITFLFDGTPISILIALLVTLSLPIIYHIVLFRKRASPPSCNFLLLGPSGAGKTAFATLLESKSSLASQKAHLTHTSQTSTLVTVKLPPTVPIASNQYRSVNDSSLKDAANGTNYCVKDTPGHGKLRAAQGIAELQTMAMSKDAKNKLRGVVFMVDTAALVDEIILRDTAAYLHDVLLVLQKRELNSSSKKLSEIPVLVAANKQDLFTSLPPGSVREKLEAEIDRIRKSRTKGLLDASMDAGLDTEEDILGNDYAQGVFNFKMLEEDTGVKVEVVGGAVKGDQQEETGSGVRRWEEWVGTCL